MRVLVASLCLLAASACLAPLALADATPVQLVLLYLPKVSNTGTPAASGIAELVMPEGEVRITAAGLPRQDDDTEYVAWVVNSDTNEFRRIGDFNTSESTGAVHYENVLPEAIPTPKQWNLLLVTIESTAGADHPSDKHSIAGVFPRPEGDPLPGVLPNTGGADPDNVPLDNRPDWLFSAGLAALAGTLGLAAGYGFGKRTR